MDAAALSSVYVCLSIDLCMCTYVCVWMYRYGMERHVT